MTAVVTKNELPYIYSYYTFQHVWTLKICIPFIAKHKLFACSRYDFLLYTAYSNEHKPT